VTVASRNWTDFARRALFLSVPFTSVPWFPVGDATVKSLCFPLAVVLGASVILSPTRQLRSHPSLSAGLVLLLVIWGPQLWQLLVRPEDFLVLTSLGVTAAERFVRSSISLLVGATLYLGFRFAVSRPDWFREAKRLVVVAIAASSAWAVLQLMGDTILPASGPVIRGLDAFLTIPANVMARGHGFAYEASWLASQQTLVALPLLYQAVLFPSSHSLFPSRGLRIGKVRLHLDHVLMGVVIAGLLATYSRLGMVVLFATTAFLLFSVSRLQGISRRGVVVAGLTVLSGTLWVALTTPYVKSMLTAVTGSSTAVEFFSSIAAGPRLALWSGAWSTFLEHPLFGVGLGQFGFHFANHVPAWAVLESEVPRFLLSGEVPNPKNMILRLLAETGVVGTLAFAYFVATHFRYGSGTAGTQATLRLRPERGRLTPEFVLGVTMGIALLGDFVSLDTFALPQLWLCLAFLLADRSKYAAERAPAVLSA